MCRLRCQIAFKVSPLIALKVSPLEPCAEVPGSPQRSLSGLLGRGDFGVQCASVDEVVRRGIFKAPALTADLTSFGQDFIANPDLAERSSQDIPLAAPDRATLFTEGPGGYTDYPPANAAVEKAL